MKFDDSCFTKPAGPCHDPAGAADKCSMIEISDGDYAAIASLLADAVGGRVFFNGSVEYGCAAFRSRLTATLLIYRDPVDPDTITGIAPVWWEFSTASPDGLLTANDFSFNELKQFIIET